MSMEITNRFENDVLVLGLDGRFDAHAAPRVEETFTTLFSQGATKVVVDFSAVGYLSSAGLRVLLVMIRKLKSAQGAIVLAGLQPHVKEVFDISGFTDLFTIEGSVQEALAAI